MLQNWKEMLVHVNEGYLSCQMDTVPQSSAFQVKYIEMTYSYKFCISAPFYQWNTESCYDLTKRISE